MRVTYRQLLGREVVDRDGNRVGRVVDLVASSPDDRHLVVTGLLVGERGLAQRIDGVRHQWRPKHVRWRDIAELDDRRIRLRVPGDQVERGE